MNLIINSIIRNRNALSLISLGCFSSIVGFLYILEYFDLLILILFLPLLYLIYQNPKFAIWLIILAIYLIPYLNALGILPRASKWIVELAIFVLIIKLVLRISFEKKSGIFPLGLLFMIAIIFLFVFSVTINKTNLITALLGFRRHFKYLVLFYLLINFDLDKKFYKKVFLILFVISIFQIPVTILQYLTWDPSQALAEFDVSGGTFGWGETTGIMGLFLGGVIYCLIGYQLYYGFNFKLLFILMLLFIPIFLSQSLASYVLIPIGLILTLFKELKNNAFKVLGFGAITILLIFMIIFFSGKYFDYGVVKNFDIRKIMKSHTGTDYFGRPTDVGKIAALIYSTKLIQENFATMTFGLGLGVTSQSYFSGYEGRLSQEFSSEGGYEMKPQLARIVTEMGILGVILYVVFFVYIYHINSVLYRNIKDKYWRSISIGFRGIIILYAMAFFYRSVLDAEPTGFIFWFISAAVYTLVKRSNFSLKMKRINFYRRILN